MIALNLPILALVDELIRNILLQSIYRPDGTERPNVCSLTAITVIQWTFGALDVSCLK